MSAKFSSVSLYGQLFFRYCTFYAFAIDSHVKISKRHKIFKTWPIAKKSNSLYSPMVDNVLKKFDFLRTLDENSRRSSVLKFPAPYSPVLTKISKCHVTFLIFGRSPKKKYQPVLPPEYHAFYKVWLKLGDINCGSSLFKIKS